MSNIPIVGLACQILQEIDLTSSDNIFDALPALSTVSKSLLDELTRFLTSPTERTLDPLRWWADRQAIYPRLSRMARDYLLVPGKFSFLLIIIFLIISLATSVDVERVFSKGRLILSHVRNRLSVESMRAVMCLNNWITAGLVSQDDVEDAARLPEIK
jgi:hypothetical protein